MNQKLLGSWLGRIKDIIAIHSCITQGEYRGKNLTRGDLIILEGICKEIYRRYDKDIKVNEEDKIRFSVFDGAEKFCKKYFSKPKFY